MQSVNSKSTLCQKLVLKKRVYKIQIAFQKQIANFITAVRISFFDGDSKNCPTTNFLHT